MTRKEAIRQTEQEKVLMSLGFTPAEAEQLRRISMTLHRWHELECGDDHRCLVRGWMNDGVNFTYSDRGHAYFEVSGQSGRNRYYRTPDRETGAKRRLAAIIKARNARVTRLPERWLDAYIQTDPRGAALYIIRPSDVPEGQSVESYYTRGVCVW